VADRAGGSKAAGAEHVAQPGGIDARARDLQLLLGDRIVAFAQQ